jgi:SulP family sulfate permease
MSQDFKPKLITRLIEGYHLADFRADALAAMTVAIVALPLSMAIAIASGVGPERGLYAAIVGGFLVSLLGGSRYQIGGPAGAFIVLVAACAATTGIEGVILATLMSGVFLILAGAMRAGTYVRLIPHAVTIGFTAGIALIIFITQIKDLLGLTLGNDPAAVLAKLAALWQARGTISTASLVVSAATIALILGFRRFAPKWPSLLLAVAIVTLVALFLPVETIFQRFGDLPRSPPAPHLPMISANLLQQALPWALQFTLLGAIESLLSAVVADSMAGSHHRPNAELIAQGVANIGSALFGGICVTGTIARTATNVRAGARSPIAGMLHSVFLLIFLLVAAPLAGHIPLAGLAGVLALVAWDMVERSVIWGILRQNLAEAVILIVTFFLVVLRDLSIGIAAGCVIAALLSWFKRRHVAR